MMNIAFRISLTVITILIALVIGLLLRRAVVRRLKRTVLDDWLVQTLGILVIFPPLIVAALASPLIISWDTSLITRFWSTSKLNVDDVKNLIRNLIETILIILLGIGTARTLMKLTIRGLGEHPIDINLRTLIGRIFYIIILTIVIFWILGIWQVSIGLPVAAIGVITVALTVAIQDILKDLVAGFYILMERPFHIGDQINTANYTGKVEDVQLRATKLRLLSGEEVTIPNSLVFGGVVINNSYYSERRATILVTLPQEEFVKDETPQKILQTLAELNTIMVKPEPTVSVSGFSSALSVTGSTRKTATLTVHFWIASSVSQADTTITQAMYALRAALPDADLAIHEPAGDR